MSNDRKTTAAELKAQIQTWANRAEMARKQGNSDLVEKALEHKREYENRLAKLQEFDED